MVVMEWQLKPEETDLSFKIDWRTIRGNVVADLDLSCALYDCKGECTEIIDFNSLISTNHSIELCGDSIGGQSKAGEESSEELYLDLDRVPKRTKAIVIYASTLSGSLAGIATMRAEVSRMRFAGDSMPGQRLRSKWETSRLLDKHLVWEGPIELVHRRRYNSIGLFRIVRTQPTIWVATTFKAVLFYCINQKERLNFAEKAMLIDIFPWLKMEEKRKFPTVKSICAALSSHALPSLKPHFVKKRGGTVRAGLKIEDFVKILFKQLLADHPDLHILKEASHVIALLSELFRQIDINGDNTVDWEEFSLFVVEEAVLGAKDGVANTDDGIHKILYVPDAAFNNKMEENALLSKSEAIVLMVNLTTSLRVLVVEENSIVFKLYDQRGEYITKYTSEASTHAPPLGSFDVIIHHVEFIHSRHTICLSCSDQTISLIQERHDGQSREPKGYIWLGKLIDDTLHRKLRWSPLANRLLSAASNNDLYFWDLDKMAIAGKLQTEGGGVLLEIAVLKDKGLIATAFIDGSIKLWSEDNLRPKGVLLKHKLGVRTMSYAQNLLLSGGFEYDIVGWDVSNRESSIVLRGHKRSIVQVTMMVPQVKKDDLLAISADESGEIRVWDLVHTVGGAAGVLQIFDLPGVDATRPLNCFVLPYHKECSHRQFSNALFGGARMVHYLPQQIMPPFVPPRCSLMNPTSGRFIVTVGPDIVKYDLWGKFHKLYQNVTASKTSITCLSLDTPRNMRLFLGDEQGNVLVVNLVSGKIISQTRLHSKEVTGLDYCGKTGYLVTTGADGTLCIAHEAKGAISSVRKIEQAHTAAITCLLYSQRLSLIVTSGMDGFCQLWDFQTTRYLTISIKQSHEITSLLVLDPYPILLTGDCEGAVIVWHLDLSREKVAPVRRLTGPSFAGNTITTICMLGDVESKSAGAGQNPPSSSLVFATTESGEVLKWRVEEIVAGLDITPLEDAMCPGNSERFNPHMKVHRKVPKNSITEFLAFDSSPVRGSKSISLEICNPMLIFRAHADVIITAYCMKGPPIIVTISNDGYQRIWSTDAEIIGEISLPSVDKQRKLERDRFLDPVEFKYKREAVRVLKKHEELALTYIAEEDHRISAASSTRRSYGASRRASKASLPVAGITSKTSSTYASHRSTRTPPTTAITTMVSTTFSLSMTTSSIGSSAGKNTTFPFPSTAQLAVSQLTREKPVSRGTTSGTPTSTSQLGRKLEQVLFAVGTVSLHEGNAHKAFSAYSLLKGAKQGFFNMEEFKLLRFMDRYPDRKLLYDQEYPFSPEKSLSKHYEALKAVQDTKKLPTTDWSIRYKNTAAILNSLKDINQNPAIKAIFDNQDLRSRHAGARSKDLHSKDGRFDAAPGVHHPGTRIYTCQRIALSDDQILAPDAAADYHRMGGISSSTISNLPETRRSYPSLRLERSSSPTMLSSLNNAGTEGGVVNKTHVMDEKAVLAKVSTAMESPDSELPSLRTPVHVNNTDSQDNKATATKRVKVKKATKTRMREPAPIKEEDLDFLKMRPGFFGPHYSIQSVIHFRELFNQVDLNLSGALDMDEWLEFLERMDHNVPAILGKKMFLAMDRDRSGLISLGELGTILFSQATPYQREVLVRLIEKENAKLNVRAETLTKDDIMKLFDYMDERSRGFLTLDDLNKAMETLQVNASKIKALQNKLHNEKGRLFNRNDFVDLMWPLVALPSSATESHHEKARANKMKKRAQIHIQPNKIQL